MSDTLGVALTTVGGLIGGLPGVSWQYMLRPASFRGIQFHYDRVSHTYGRRFAMHEYPGRDLPWAEDLGRSQRTWSFNAYLIGDLFPVMRERLLAACEQQGPGTLVLPLDGRVTVVCTQCSYDDSRTEGRYSAIQLSFAEAGAEQVPANYADTRSQISDNAAALGSASESYFVSGFDVGSPSDLTASARSLSARSDATASGTAIRTSLLSQSAAANAAALGEMLESQRASSADYDQAPLIAAIDVLTSHAYPLVFDAQALFDAVDNAFALFTESMPADRAFFGMLTIAHQYEATEVPAAAIDAPSSPELREAESRNGSLFQSMVRRLALREAGYALPGIDLDNTERAEQIRKVVFDAFLGETDIAAVNHNDDAFRALTSLAWIMLDDIDQRAAQLPSLAWYRTPRSLNALTLAYSLYGDAARNLDIVARVGAINPAFMPLSGRVLDR